jgi:hypothetical protein
MTENMNKAIINLDMDLSEIVDLPGFTQPLSGTYLVTLEKGIVQKDIGDHPAFEIACTIQEVMETLEQPDVDAGETLTKVGDIWTPSFLLDNEYGVDQFKKFVTPIAQKLGNGNIRWLTENTKGLALMIIGKREQDRKDPTKKYFRPKKVSVV